MFVQKAYTSHSTTVEYLRYFCIKITFNGKITKLELLEPFPSSIVGEDKSPVQGVISKIGSFTFI